MPRDCRRLRGGTTDSDYKRSTCKLEREGTISLFCVLCASFRLTTTVFFSVSVLVLSRLCGSKTEFELDCTPIVAFQDC